jgi:hypothetical protein
MPPAQLRESPFVVKGLNQAERYILVGRQIQVGRQASRYEGAGISQAATQRQTGKQVESRRLKQGSTCKLVDGGRQREAQAASHTCRNAGGQELLSRHTRRPTSRKARTGRHAGSAGRQRQLGRQKRQGNTVKEVSARTQKQGKGREANCRQW